MPQETPEEHCEKIVAEWYASNPDTVGIANAGLVVIEHFRGAFPLTESDYLSPGKGQVKGLNGANATNIVRRFRPTAPPFGTEAGRTSRGTPAAASRLATELNRLDITPEQRGHLADVMQEWIIVNPLNVYWSKQRVKPAIDPRSTSLNNMSAVLEEARRRGGNAPGAVAQHLVGAKLALRFGDENVPNHSYAAADAVTGRSGDFQIGDTIFHVTMSPGLLVMEKSKKNLDDGYRVTLLVPEDKLQGAKQIADTQELSGAVTILSIESFVGQNIDELSGFKKADFSQQLRRLFEVYNQRVEAVEPDKSLQIEIPANL